MIRIRSTKGRFLTLHTATLVLLALLIDFVAVFRKPYYMDAVLILSLLTFLGTLASVRHRSERKIF